VSVLAIFFSHSKRLLERYSPIGHDVCFPTHNTVAHGVLTQTHKMSLSNMVKIRHCQ